MIMLRKRDIAAVDISDQSIKILELNHNREVVAYGSIRLDQGIVKDGLIVDEQAFKVALDEVLENTQPKKLRPREKPLQCIASLPSSQMFVYYLQVPDTIDENNIEQYVTKEAEKIIPYNLSEMYFTHHLAHVDDVRHVTFVAAPRAIVDNYMKVLTEADLRPVALGGAFFSLGRSLLPDILGVENYLIVDIGSRTSSVGIFGVDAIAHFTTRVSVAGTYITEVISQKLQVSMEEAEELKRKKGLLKEEKGDGVANIVTECISQVLTEIENARRYYEKKYGTVMSEVVLSGGTALMPGLISYIEAKTGLKTRLGNPFQKIKEHDTFGSETHAIFFAGVIGLALRALDERLPGVDLLTQYREDREGEGKERIPFSEVRSLEEVKYVLRDMLDRVRKKDSAIIHRLHLDIKIDVKLLLSLMFVVAMIALLVVVIIKYI